MDRIFNSDQLNASKASLFARKNFDAPNANDEPLNSSWSSIVSAETADVKLSETDTDSSAVVVTTDESDNGENGGDGNGDLPSNGKVNADVTTAESEESS